MNIIILMILLVHTYRYKPYSVLIDAYAYSLALFTSYSWSTASILFYETLWPLIFLLLYSCDIIDAKSPLLKGWVSQRSLDCSLGNFCVLLGFISSVLHIFSVTSLYMQDYLLDFEKFQERQSYSLLFYFSKIFFHIQKPCFFDWLYWMYCQNLFIFECVNYSMQVFFGYSCWSPA